MVSLGSSDGASSRSGEVPIHPVPALQGPFEESIMEAMTQGPPDISDDNLDAGERRAKLLNIDKYTRVVAGRWKQKPGEKYHPLWKLSAQLSFGIHLLAQGIAKSDEDVMQILQSHVDDVDNFLERTSEDIELAQTDIQDRLEHLRLPFSHIEVFDRMLEGRSFRNSIVAGNEKIEHIVTRTTAALKDALKDCRKGLEATRSLLQYLESLKGSWKTTSPDFEAVYIAMVGNCEGWNLAFRDLIGKADRLSIALVQLTGVVDEMQRRCGIISRKGLMTLDATFNLSPDPPLYHAHKKQGSIQEQPRQVEARDRSATAPARGGSVDLPPHRSASNILGRPPTSGQNQQRREYPTEKDPGHRRQFSKEENSSQRNRLRKRPSAPIMKYKDSLAQKQGVREAVIEPEVLPRATLSREVPSLGTANGAKSERSSQQSTASTRKGSLSAKSPGDSPTVQQKKAPSSRGAQSPEVPGASPGLSRKPSFTKRLFGRKRSISSSKAKESFVAAPTVVKTPSTVQKKAQAQIVSVPSRIEVQTSPALPSPDPSLPSPPGLVPDEASKRSQEFFTALPETPSSNPTSRDGSSETATWRGPNSNSPREAIKASKAQYREDSMASSSQQSPQNTKPESPNDPPDRPSISRRPSRFKEDIGLEQPLSITSPASVPDNPPRSPEHVAKSRNNVSPTMPAPLFSHTRNASAVTASSTTGNIHPPRRPGIPRQSSLPSLTRTKLSPPTEAPPPPPPGGRKLVEPDWSTSGAFYGEKRTHIGRKVSLKKPALDGEALKKIFVGGSANSSHITSTSPTAKEPGFTDESVWFSRMGKDGVWVAGEAVR